MEPVLHLATDEFVPPAVRADQPGIWKYRDFFGVDEGVEPISLGEGDTPIVRTESLADVFGLRRLDLKMESANPTWSHKDRLASVGISVAKSQGYEGVILASSGNQGAAAAAYCARAGLPCIVLVTADTPPMMLTLLQAYGAAVVSVPEAVDRWTVMEAALRSNNWYPLSGFTSPPVGSNRSAVGGYASLAVEIFLQSGGDVPDVIVVPTSHADTIAGMWRGFKHLQQSHGLKALPRMMAVEPFGSLEKSLAAGSDVALEGRGGETRAFSIAGRMGTAQGLRAIRESRGAAIAVDDDAMLDAYRDLGTREGVFAEPSAAMGVAGVRELRRRGEISSDESVLALITSTGMKDPGYFAETASSVPAIAPSIEQFASVMSTSYGLDVRVN